MVGARTTDCHGPGPHGTVPQIRSRRRSGHGRLQKNLHLADAHSAGVRCRDCLLREGATEQDVVERLQRDTTARPQHNPLDHNGDVGHGETKFRWAFWVTLCAR
jgi:hypothetical protein